MLAVAVRYVGTITSACLAPSCMLIYVPVAGYAITAFHPEQPVLEKDIQMGSFYVSQNMDPANFFTSSRLAVRLTLRGRTILNNDELSHHVRQVCTSP